MVDPKVGFQAGAASPAYSTVQPQWVWTFDLVTHASGTLRGSGPCPRCGHAINVLTTIAMALEFVEPTSITRDQTIQCACSDKHKGRPADKQGCGYETTVAVTAEVGS